MPRRLVVGLLSVHVGCAADRPPAAASPAPVDDCANLSDGVHCLDREALVCAAGSTVSRDDCSDTDAQCFEGRGCGRCLPGSVRCDEWQLSRCRADGTGFDETERCLAPSVCSPEGCRDLCAEAKEQRSYLGCRYFPALPINSELDPAFTQALVIGNPNLVTATITVSRMGRAVQHLSVPAGAAQSFAIPREDTFARRGRSVLARAASYVLEASVPVTVQQWNPLEFKSECRDEGGAEGSCESVTNDASLLVPTEALLRDSEPLRYLVATQPTFVLRTADGEASGRSGFVMVIGASDAIAHVEIATRSHTEPSAADDSENVPALAPGETLQIALGRGDVLQLLSAEDAACAEDPVPVQNGLFACAPVAGYDLTGTEIRADAPVSVITGHDCTNIPFDRPACDHLEESLVPIDTWGRVTYVPRLRSYSNVPFVVQVISADDDNLVSVGPDPTALVRLARGETYSFVSSHTMQIRGTGRLMALQYLEGQGTGDFPSDPSMTIAVPPDQWRDDYAFLTPSSFARSFATFIGRAGVVLELDGRRLPPLPMSDDVDFGVYTALIDVPGAHRVTSVDGSIFGVQLHGVADYTSYMCPGGLDLRILPEPG